MQTRLNIPAIFLTLILAVNYSGKWDILQAVNRYIENEGSNFDKIDKNPEAFSRYLSTEGIPDPDLMIRTSGEMRISNFLLWQLAYTEFYFTDALWPDFDQDALQRAINSFKGRQRRFGHTGEQVIDNRVL